MMRPRAIVVRHLPGWAHGALMQLSAQQRRSMNDFVLDILLEDLRRRGVLNQDDPAGTPTARPRRGSRHAAPVIDDDERRPGESLTQHWARTTRIPGVGAPPTEEEWAASEAARAEDERRDAEALRVQLAAHRQRWGHG